MTWKWQKRDEKGLARFVAREAADLLELDIEERPSLLQDADGRRQIIEAIYDALQQKEVRYALEKYHPADVEQLIRTPREVLETPREGTCLDLALLFCGACLGYDLIPVMVLVEGHALAAVSLSHQLSEWAAFNRGELPLFAEHALTDAASLRALVDEGGYLAVECTGFARSKELPKTLPEGKGRNFKGLLSFDRAIAAGREQLENEARPLRFALDIAVAQYDWELEPALPDEAPGGAGGAQGSEVNVGVGAEFEDAEIGEVVGVDGADAPVEKVNVLNNSTVRRTKIDSIIGVRSTPSKDGS